MFVFDPAVSVAVLSPATVAAVAVVVAHSGCSRYSCQLLPADVVHHLGISFWAESVSVGQQSDLEEMVTMGSWGVANASEILATSVDLGWAPVP